MHEVVSCSNNHLKNRSWGAIHVSFSEVPFINQIASYNLYFNMALDGEQGVKFYKNGNVNYVQILV